MGDIITPNTNRWRDFNDADDQSLDEDMSEIELDVTINPEAIKTYLQVVFGNLGEGYIPLRSFAESTDQRDTAPHNIWVSNDETRAGTVKTFAAYCHNQQRACYCIPGIVKAKHQAKASDIVQMGVLLVDIDHGDIAAKLEHAVMFIGKPTLVVASGGVTETGQAKRHVYWQLSKPAEQDELAKLVALRHQLARKIAADEHFQSAHQPIRLAGTVHHKRAARMVAYRSITPPCMT